MNQGLFTAEEAAKANVIIFKDAFPHIRIGMIASAIMLSHEYSGIHCSKERAIIAARMLMASGQAFIDLDDNDYELNGTFTMPTDPSSHVINPD